MRSTITIQSSWARLRLSPPSETDDERGRRGRRGAARGADGGSECVGSARVPPMWYRLRRLNVPLRQTVFYSTAATGATAVAVGTGWLSPPRAYAAPSGGALANATGRVPEWGSENAHAVRTDWACIGANKASEDRLVVAEGGGGVVCAVFDGHYGPRASEFCRQNFEAYFAKVRGPRGLCDAPAARPRAAVRPLRWARGPCSIPVSARARGVRHAAAGTCARTNVFRYLSMLPCTPFAPRVKGQRKPARRQLGRRGGVRLHADAGARTDAVTVRRLFSQHPGGTNMWSDFSSSWRRAGRKMRASSCDAVTGLPHWKGRVPSSRISRLGDWCSAISATAARFW